MDAKAIYKTTVQNKPSTVASAAVISGKSELTPFVMTADMFDPSNPVGKKKTLTIDPVKPVGERVVETIEGMKPDEASHIRSSDVQTDPQPLWKKIMKLDDDQLIEQMGGLGALKDYINKTHQDLLPEGKPIPRQARKTATMEKVRMVFDKLDKSEDEKKED